jgi:hypothetical protein
MLKGQDTWRFQGVSLPIYYKVDSIKQEILVPEKTLTMNSKLTAAPVLEILLMSTGTLQRGFF